jgi:Flp pilus assembly protein TadD
VVARCLAYIAGADPAKAEAICLPDWAKHPDTIATYEARGLLRLKQGRDQEAFEALDACVKARAWDAEPLYGRGLARLRLGRKAEAEADMAEARRLRPDIAARYADFGIR